MLPDGIRTRNLSRRAAAELRLRPRGQWYRQTLNLNMTNSEQLLKQLTTYSTVLYQRQMATQIDNTEIYVRKSVSNICDGAASGKGLCF